MWKSGPPGALAMLSFPPKPPGCWHAAWPSPEEMGWQRLISAATAAQGVITGVWGKKRLNICMCWSNLLLSITLNIVDQALQIETSH